MPQYPPSGNGEFNCSNFFSNSSLCAISLRMSFTCSWYGERIASVGGFPDLFTSPTTFSLESTEMTASASFGLFHGGRRSSQPHCGTLRT